MQELAEVGYGRLSIEAVARRAGVGKTAVYRRWDSKLELVLEIVSEVAGQRLPVPDTGTLRGDLTALARSLELALRHPLASQIIPDLLVEAARTPQIADTLLRTLRTHQSDIATTMIGRAVERGEVAADVDAELALDLILGSLYWQLAIMRSKPPKTYVSALVEVVVRGLAGGSSAAADRT